MNLTLLSIWEKLNLKFHPSGGLQLGQQLYEIPKGKIEFINNLQIIYNILNP